MKNSYFRFRIMLFTLAFGLASVWFFHNIKIFDDTEIKDATIVTIAPKLPKFTETFRACGMGYIQGYSTDDGIKLTEGNLGCQKPAKKDRSIIQSDKERIISKVNTQGSFFYTIYEVETITCIHTPNIKLGLELEEYLKGIRN